MKTWNQFFFYTSSFPPGIHRYRDTISGGHYSEFNTHGQTSSSVVGSFNDGWHFIIMPFFFFWIGFHFEKKTSTNPYDFVLNSSFFCSTDIFFLFFAITYENDVKVTQNLRPSVLQDHYFQSIATSIRRHVIITIRLFFMCVLATHAFLTSEIIPSDRCPRRLIVRLTSSVRIFVTTLWVVSIYVPQDTLSYLGASFKGI